MLEEQINHLAEQYSNEKLSAKALYNIAEGSNMDYYPFPSFGKWLSDKESEKQRQAVLTKSVIQRI